MPSPLLLVPAVVWHWAMRWSSQSSRRPRRRHRLRCLLAKTMGNIERKSECSRYSHQSSVVGHQSSVVGGWLVRHQLVR